MTECIAAALAFSAEIQKSIGGWDDAARARFGAIGMVLSAG
ncbi:hypothetical protein [Burkholderia cepacia]|nr:hypothetical protein [Burkholderia cepacia]